MSGLNYIGDVTELEQLADKQKDEELKKEMQVTAILEKGKYTFNDTKPDDVKFQ